MRILEGSFTKETFMDFIRDLLDFMNPYPAANSVLVMDNCAIHKSEELSDLIEER